MRRNMMWNKPRLECGCVQDTCSTWQAFEDDLLPGIAWASFKTFLYIKKNEKPITPETKNKKLIFAKYCSWEALDGCKILLQVVGTICLLGKAHSVKKKLNLFLGRPSNARERLIWGYFQYFQAPRWSKLWFSNISGSLGDQKLWSLIFPGSQISNPSTYP